MKREYSLKKLKKRNGPVKTDKTAVKVPISLRIDGTVLSDLKTEAERQGIPYQTLIGSILFRYSRGELHDKNSTKKFLKIANE